MFALEIETETEINIFINKFAFKIENRKINFE